MMFRVQSRYIADCHRTSHFLPKTFAVLHKSCERSHNGSVLFCPGCHVSQAVNITANLPAGAMPRWRGQCLDCDHTWDFDDE